jgi:hypothetical protein
METEGDVSHVKSHFGSFGDGVSVTWNLVSVRLDMMFLLVQDRYTVLRRTYHRIKNHFRRTRSNS